MTKKLSAEFVGTFFIVVAPVLASRFKADLMTSAMVSGLAVLAMIYALGPVSGAHFNPAVTLGFAAAGRFPWRQVASYMGAQFAGAIAGAGLVAALFGPGFGAHIPSGSAGQSVAVEVLLGFLLMLVIAAVATDKRVHPGVPGAAIGLTVVLGVLIGGPISGGSMNPARSFGPAVFNPGALGVIYVYLLAPAIGAVLAARFFELIRSDPEP